MTNQKYEITDIAHKEYPSRDELRPRQPEKAGEKKKARHKEAER